MAKVFGEVYSLWTEKVALEKFPESPSDRNQYHVKADSFKREWQHKGLLPSDDNTIQVDPTGLPPSYVISLYQLRQSMVKELAESQAKVARFGKEKKAKKEELLSEKIDFIFEILGARTKFIKETCRKKQET